MKKMLSLMLFVAGVVALAEPRFPGGPQSPQLVQPDAKFFTLIHRQIDLQPGKHNFLIPFKNNLARDVRLTPGVAEPRPFDAGNDFVDRDWWGNDNTPEQCRHAFRAPTNGYYSLQAQVRLVGNANNQKSFEHRAVKLMKDGAQMAVNQIGGGNNIHDISVSFTTVLKAGECVQVVASYESLPGVTAVAVSHEPSLTYFSGFKIQ